MALFQKSVLNQHLKQLDKSKVATAYALFKAHFHDPAVQQHIRNSKEEQYQEGFCRDLFRKVLGYTINPSPGFNLITEQKNETDSKKADAAILKDNDPIAVIELKGTNTVDLGTVTTQAFGYKNNQKNCIYVITSNFEKLRFYIENAIDFEEFDLFNLTEDRFQVLYICLHESNLFSGIPLKLKKDSTVKEESVTKQLYKDYSEFKRKLFTDIVKLNPQYDKLSLFKKSQKLLDRILFILFAEDRGLLQANTIHSILDKFEQLQKLDAQQPLYSIFKKHFSYLNNGFKNDQYDVFGYNGGLFADDEMLDNITISDNILLNYTPTLSKYDFDTEVDVNILGHIFEHSLNDIEEIQAEIEGKVVEKSKTKRKKDGVYYTPKYITKYIVENTVGTLCKEKRLEHGVIDENYTPGNRKAKKKELLQKLDNYQEWLLHITIVDPACGSGAFLNQALEFLIQEHKNIDEMRALLLGHSMVLPDHEIDILENNLFGVDLNEESVEIARLSLWLRTARKGRKLNSLNNNIKCGNSLIDDPAIAGSKAFNWQNEFPAIFANGGFDVVIGNPPYISNKEMHRNSMQKDIKFWNQSYVSAKSGNYDLYIPFIEKGLLISKASGYFSFIIPNKFLLATYSNSLLQLIHENYHFEKIVDYSNVDVFPDASVYPIIIILKNFVTKEKLVNRIIVSEGAKEDFSAVKVWNFIDHKYANEDQTYNSIIEKIETIQNTINDSLSFEPGINGFQFTNYAKCVTEGKSAADGKRLVVTGNIDPFVFLNNLTRYKKKDYVEPYINYNSEIISEGKWSLFSKPKVMIAGMTKRIEASLDVNGNYAPAVSVYSIVGNIDILYSVILLINSKLINWFFNHKFSDKHLAGGYISINNELIKQIPFLKIPTDQNASKLYFTSNSKRIELEILKTQFAKFISAHFEITFNNNLQNWPYLTYDQFYSYLQKQKIKVSIKEKAELMQYFEKEKAKANAIQKIIDDTDKEIDQMVYKLYDLTPEEIAIVESNN